MKVNDSFLTNIDFRKRFALLSLLNNTSADELTYERLYDQVQQLVIRETLQRNLLDKQNAGVSDEEYRTSFETMLQGNRTTSEEFYKNAEEKGVSRYTVDSFYRLQLGWQGFLVRQFGQTLRPTDEEVKEKQQELIAQSEQRRYVYREILILENEKGSRSAIERITGMLKSGADIANVARSFSQAASAYIDGVVGPIAEGELDEELRKTLANMRPLNEVQVLPYTEGHLIVQLLQVLEPQVLSGFTQAYTYNEILSDGKIDLSAFQRRLVSCRLLPILERQFPIQVRSYRSRLINDIPQRYRTVLGAMKKEESKLLAEDTQQEGVILQLCAKERIFPGIASQDQLANQIFEYRVGQLSSKLIAEQYRSSYVEIVREF